MCVVGIQSERVRTYFFSVAGTVFWSSMTAREHTRGADRSAWVTSGSLPSLERPADLSTSLKWQGDFCLQSKITDLILSFPVPCGYMNFSPFAWETSRPLPFAWATSGSQPSVQNYRRIFFSSTMRIYEYPLRLRIFLLMTGYRNLHTSIFFFPVICWSYLRTEISIILSIGNKLYSCRHILYFSFLWKPLCWFYLATALNLLISSTALCR